MKISIVTISFNQAEFLERTIQSVLNQNYPELEYIIVDPGSTDGSRDIIERYRSQISHILFEPDTGPGNGLNKGFSMATGEIFGYLNSDDTLLPGSLTYVAEQFAINNNIDILSGHGFVIDKNDNLIHKVFSHPFSLTSYAAGCCVLVQQSTFFRSSVFKNSTGFNEQNRICWDGELMVDLAIRGAKFKLVRQYLSCFRIYDESITGSGLQVSEKYKNEHERIRQKIIDAGFSPKVRIFEWILTRAKSPLSTIDRLIDGFQNKKRLV